MRGSEVDAPKYLTKAGQFQERPRVRANMIRHQKIVRRYIVELFAVTGLFAVILGWAGVSRPFSVSNATELLPKIYKLPQMIHGTAC